MKTRWRLALVTAAVFAGLSISMIQPGEAAVAVSKGQEASGVAGPAPCDGCMALLNFNHTKTGTSCGNSISIRIQFNTNSDGLCLQVTPCGPTDKPCYFDWDIEYLSSTCCVDIAGYDCVGTLPGYTCLTATGAWTHAFNRSTFLDCGGTCDIEYGIKCNGSCATVRFSPDFKCSACEG